MTTWQSDREPQLAPISLAGWLRVLLRGGALLTVILTGLILMILLRLVERPLHGLHRPWTPYITQAVCRIALRILGIRLRVQGHLMHRTGAVVANHSSWLDIFVLNARKRIYFVSKSEVAGWPGIGWLAKVTGTLFIARQPREAKAQTKLFEARLLAGHKLLFFPEGTSTDGQQVLPFKSTLFAAFFAPALRSNMWVQPVSVSYHAPPGADLRFYGWWGDMDLGPHLLQILAAWQRGSVTVTYHPPLRVEDFHSRKVLAKACETAVRGGVTG